REREVGFGSRAEVDVNGQVVPAVVDDVLIESVAEVVDLAVGVKAPVGGVVLIEARMLAAEDALLAALARRLAGVAGARDEGRAVAADDQSLEIAEQSALCGRDDGGGEQKVFQAGEEVLRPGLIFPVQELLFEINRD